MYRFRCICSTNADRNSNDLMIYYFRKTCQSIESETKIHYSNSPWKKMREYVRNDDCNLLIKEHYKENIVIYSKER